MANLKSFIYLDEQKLHSLASQVFEGLVSRYIESEIKDKSEKESQKGPVGSGHIMADVLQITKHKQEYRFLHDYLFTMFEQELMESKAITIVTSANAPNICPFQLVKVTGCAKFNDFSAISKTVLQFNDIGFALSYMSTFDEQQKLQKKITEEAGNIKDGTKRLRAQSKSMHLLKNQIKKYAEEAGLNLDPQYLKNLCYLLDFGVGGLLEVQLTFDNLIATTILDRKYLKEDEKILITKYSRVTEMPICLVGIVLQSLEYEPPSTTEASISTEASVRNNLHVMVDRLIDIENAFTGKSKGELIIDPIALYTEL